MMCISPNIVRHLYMMSILFNKQCIIDEHARGVMVIVVRNGHGGTSSNPGRD